MIDCGEIIFPVTPPEEFEATVRIGLRSSRVADTCCNRPNSAFAEVSEPVMNTPSHPSTGEKNANIGPVAASDQPSVVVMPEALPTKANPRNAAIVTKDHASWRVASAQTPANARSGIFRINAEMTAAMKTDVPDAPSQLKRKMAGNAAPVSGFTTA